MLASFLTRRQIENVCSSMVVASEMYRADGESHLQRGDQIHWSVVLYRSSWGMSFLSLPCRPAEFWLPASGRHMAQAWCPPANHPQSPWQTRNPPRTCRTSSLHRNYSGTHTPTHTSSEHL